MCSVLGAHFLVCLRHAVHVCFSANKISSLLSYYAWNCPKSVCGIYNNRTMCLSLVFAPRLISAIPTSWANVQVLCWRVSFRFACSSWFISVCVLALYHVYCHAYCCVHCLWEDTQTHCVCFRHQLILPSAAGEGRSYHSPGSFSRSQQSSRRGSNTSGCRNNWHVLFRRLVLNAINEAIIQLHISNFLLHVYEHPFLLIPMLNLCVSDATNADRFLTARVLQAFLTLLESPISDISHWASVLLLNLTLVEGMRVLCGVPCEQQL